MIHPKYSTEEALERVKLMIKYDTSRTLSENKKIINEQDNNSDNLLYNTSIPGVVGGVGGFIAGEALAGLGLGSALGPVGALIGVVGGVVFGVIKTFMSAGDAKKKCYTLFNSCVLMKNQIGKPTMSDDQLDKLADRLNDAMEHAGFLNGTDEEAIKKVFLEINTIPDLCGLCKNYEESYNKTLYKALEWDLEDDHEWEQYVSLPLRNACRNTRVVDPTNGDRQKNINGNWCFTDKKDHIIKNPNLRYNGKSWEQFVKDFKITAEEIEIAQKTPCPQQINPNPIPPNPTPPKPKPKPFKECKGPVYTIGCMSDYIAKAQGCISNILKSKGMNGISIDRKFGQNTKKAIINAGYPKYSTQFTEEIVDMVWCVANNPNPVNPDTKAEIEKIDSTPYSQLDLKNAEVDASIPKILDTKAPDYVKPQYSQEEMIQMMSPEQQRNYYKSLKQNQKDQKRFDRRALRDTRRKLRDIDNTETTT